MTNGRKKLKKAEKTFKKYLTSVNYYDIIDLTKDGAERRADGVTMKKGFYFGDIVTDGADFFRVLWTDGATVCAQVLRPIYGKRKGARVLVALHTTNDERTTTADALTLYK